MKKMISAELAGNLLLIAFGVLFVVHVLVLLGALPADIVWGGMIQGRQINLVILESIALLVTLLLMMIVAVKTGDLRAGKFSGAVNIGIWLVFVFLLLNTLWNLASGVSFEKLVAAPITLILALCALRLAVEK